MAQVRERVSLISDFRQSIFNLLLEPVHEAGYGCTPYLPDDLAVLPCVVVGRVSVNFQGTQLGIEARLTVYIIGSRLTSDDTQKDLDDLTDQVLTWLLEAGTPVVGVEPTVQLVNSNNHPAYEITCLAGKTF